jgi:hypothetical protein
MACTPREKRDLERGRRAAMAARANGASAMEAALVHIATAFDEAAAISSYKRRVERLIRLGPAHMLVRARFSARAALLSGRDLDRAMALVERWYRDERTAFAIASALGRANRLSWEVLRELRLMLRLLRFKRMHADFGAIVEALCDTAVAIAAE